MIRLTQPSLALHSCDVPGYKYQMKWTWKMPPKAAGQDVVYWILYAADHSKEMRLDNVIINCHANNGYLAVGGKDVPGIGVENVGVFSLLRDTDIGTIWLTGCDVAGIGKGADGRNGMYFCSQLAKTVGCDVVAADVDQHVDLTFYLRFCPWGCVDDFEGVAYRFDAAGGYTVYSH